ncbi:MAG: protein-disulfide reductase DsbD [Mizugakiibacter sp.]|uniref:protein-disulfide reductase DsbD n=1 Tax=Mizugakiibacter sp. TaxID=1972610 RepID=UPI0031C68328|nr:protein-disulfide reductase DsbD [Xanthomonadaceae bacterium]
MTFARLGRAALALLCIALAAPAFAQDDGLLAVTDAFRLTASVEAPGRVHLHWKIAEHYYLYRGRIHAKTATPGVALGELALPDGLKKHDEFLGDVEVYHDRIDATLPYTTDAAAPATLELAVQFQGCHEVDPKICYPPYTQKLSLALPAAVPAPAGGLADALGKLGGAASRAGRADLPLPPERAFVFDAIAAAPDQLLLRWRMPKGYYLYRDRTTLRLVDAGDVAPGAPQWPAATMHADPQFGTVAVYFDEVDLPVPLTRTAGAARRLVLEARFQGCQDGGICYPPMTRTATLQLPATATASAAPADAGAASAGGQSEEQQLAGALQRHGRWLALLSFFGFGLLLAFTPCVLPMVPILSGLIAGAGAQLSTARAFALSLVYVLASSVVFTAAGVIAGLAGANLQATFQQPWILWSFAALFVLLALSMFGFYELQLPASWQAKLAAASNRQRGGSLAGVAVMGVLSALIVGPCVAPPLAAAVLYIGQTRDPLFGGLALFLLSLGMGAPLLAFGTAAGRLLPRSGAWMETVKAAFGVAFLGLAIWMLARILDPLWIMLMTGALLTACAVYLGALERLPEGASGWKKLWKALGLLLLIAGAAELVGAAAGGRDLLQPLRGIAGGAQQEAGLAFRTVKGVDGLDRALAEAAAQGQPVMLDFYADWCVSCKEMERFVYTRPEVHQALSGYVLLKADVTANDAADQALLRRYGLFGPPATLFFGKDGQERRALRLIGYENAARFVARAHDAAGA